MRLGTLRKSLIAVSLGALAGCGPSATRGGAATEPSVSNNASATTAGGTVTVVAPTIPRAAFDVAAGELGDADVYRRIRHRVRLVRQGMAYLKADGPRADDSGAATTLDARPIFPVLGESPDRIRVVVEDDNARVALWIMRSDTATTALAPVQLADATGHAPDAAGVWLGAGASLDAGATAAGLREVTLRGAWVRARGFVPAAALGNVWIAGEREGFEPTTSDDETRAPVETGATVAATVVRATADAHAPVVAEVLQMAPVRVVGTHGAWTEIELHAPRARVRGFVPASAIGGAQPLQVHGMGHGKGLGMSDTLELDVPAGTCLYDSASGEVAGVELRPQKRFSPGGHTVGWWPVLVDTDWGIVTAYVHDPLAASDPKSAVFESCAAKK